MLYVDGKTDKNARYAWLCVQLQMFGSFGVFPKALDDKGGRVTQHLNICKFSSLPNRN